MISPENMGIAICGSGVPSRQKVRGFDGRAFPLPALVQSSGLRAFPFYSVLR
jgi:hypothetical protein